MNGGVAVYCLFSRFGIGGKGVTEGEGNTVLVGNGDGGAFFVTVGSGVSVGR